MTAVIKRSMTVRPTVNLFLHHTNVMRAMVAIPATGITTTESIATAYRPNLRDEPRNAERIRPSTEVGRRRLAPPGHQHPSTWVRGAHDYGTTAARSNAGPVQWRRGKAIARSARSATGPRSFTAPPCDMRSRSCAWRPEAGSVPGRAMSSARQLPTVAQAVR